MWLPSVESGGQGGGGRLQSSRNAPSAAPPPGTKGLIYPGPQRIRSDPPQPSNHFQTLLQPDLEALPLLRPPLDLLNLVSMTEVDPVLQPELPDQAVGQPDTVKPEEQQPVKPSDRVATEPVQSGLEVLPLSRPPLDLLDLVSMTDVGPVPQPEPSHLAGGQPDTIKPEEQQPVKPSDGVATEPVQSAVKPQPQTPIDASKPLELAPLPARGANMRNLLALTPMPTLRERPIEIPKGEARGRFAISPEPNLARSETDSTLGKLPSVVTLGNQTGAPGGEIAGTGIADSQVTIAFGPSVSGGGGAGTTPGSRPGSASGPGIGSGSGASDGPGRGPFAGITIVGGIRGTEPPKDSIWYSNRIPRPVQTAYDLSVLSTEHAGGGLPTFGVFSNQQIHTVYLDMAQTEIDSAPPWTLEFAEPQPKTPQARKLDESQQGLVLPFPAVKEKPSLPLELVRRHLGKMVVVYAVISVDGKMEQVSVKQSPDPLLNEPVLHALSKWAFRPAVLDGEPVVVKALLGIPLWLPACPPEKSRPPCTATTYANLEAELKSSRPAGHERDSLPVADHP